MILHQPISVFHLGTKHMIYGSGQPTLDAQCQQQEGARRVTQKDGKPDLGFKGRDGFKEKHIADCF
jgi:hypothetical protein